MHSEPSSAAEVSSDVLSSSAVANAAAAMDSSGGVSRPPAKLVRMSSVNLMSWDGYPPYLLLASDAHRDNVKEKEKDRKSWLRIFSVLHNMSRAEG